MTTDRRQEILRLYHLALAREADDRRDFLAQACESDDDLRHDVESLLAQDPPDSFLDLPALSASAVLPSADQGGILIGRQIGPYRVDSRLESGGMGDVYRATDTTLGRTVAIKVLPLAFARDPERRARLEREAKALAALNHPHIAHVYGLQSTADSPASDGSIGSALVMEFVDGETLAHVLKKRQLPIDDALRYGAQIADALATAHAHGVVHRDVKPANVMIGESGVKVLDFGLAKLLNATSDAAETALPRGEGMTHPHEVLGTVAYMSPEQAEGKAIDSRSDVFSFGVVLYEMLCGQRPFSGDTPLATLAATLKSAPPRPRSVRKDIPTDVERIVLRCLEKEPEARYRSAREVHQALNAHLVSRSAGRISRRAALAVASLLVLVAVVGLSARSYVQASRLRWVEQEAVPEVVRLIAENRRLAAVSLYRTAERYAPGSRALAPLTQVVAPTTISFTSTPPAARIYVSDYVAAAGDDLSEWQLLGETPLTINWMPQAGYYRMRALKEGFAPAERTVYGQRTVNVEVTLHPEKDVPAGMAWIPAMDALVPGPWVAPRIKLPGFWMDKYEVTNRQFKAFVDAGGYQKEEYWKEPLVKEGRTVSWREAIDGFRDATNRPGPASWQLGSFPEGTGDMPVGGVSWYEAAAYARFAGKNLPTLHEWWGATIFFYTGISDIVRLSNLASHGVEPVGANRGMGVFGTYDMAGNVKEWVANPSGNQQRLLLGGAWPEATSVFTVADPRTPFSRDHTFGFRCVRRITSPPDDAFASFAAPPRAVHGPPVDDATFERFVNLHAYDKTDLEPRVASVDDASSDWRRETVSFQAGYGTERALAHVFLPKGSTPPYQIVVYLGGSGIHTIRRVEEIGPGYQFILRGGRAVVIPVLDGTLERGPSEFQVPVNQARVRDLRWSMDMGRTVDYLETRRDLDIQKLGFYGFSAGANYGIRLTTLDRRFKVAALSAAGLFRQAPPETDPLNFAPRARIPVLMLNGRDDFMLPYETSQRPLFEALGTKDKVLKRYDGGHLSVANRPDLMREILDWFDKYLGPVNQQP